MNRPPGLCVPYNEHRRGRCGRVGFMSRFILKRRRSSVTRRLSALILVSVLTVLTLGAGGRVTGQAVKNPDTFVTLRFGDPQTLDPDTQYDTASYEIVYPNVYETLIGYNGSVLSTYVPRLATEVPSLANGLLSKDGLTYSFPIRKGVKFHDGSVMTRKTSGTPCSASCCKMSTAAPRGCSSPRWSARRAPGRTARS